MLVLLLAACHHPAQSTPATLAWVDPDGARLTVDPDGALRLADPEGRERVVRLSFGFVADPTVDMNYDPWNLKAADLAGAVPNGLTWAETESADCDTSGCITRLTNGAGARLAVDETGPGLRLGWTQDPLDPVAPYARVTVAVDGAEGLYGLGEVFEAVEHRGRVQAMQFEADATLESGYNEAHVPVPLLVSDAGWGLLVDSYHPGVWDLAAADPGAVEAIFNHAGGLTVDLYGPGSPPAVVARYHQRTGPPELPPTWAYAPMQWRNEVDGQDTLLADAAAIREHAVPTGLIWVDNPWQTTYNSMRPDPAMFPDWEAMVDTLHARGFRFMAWTTPYLEPADPEHGAYEAAGWFVDAPILFNDFGDWVDLTHPDALAAWTARAGAEPGIEGWKLDYGEDAQVGFGQSRLRYAFANGEDERTMHHQYALYYHRAYAPDPAGTFLLGRAGALGGHTVTDCVWPGDLDPGFERFGEDGLVGGLPSAIRAGTGLSVSGYPFFASDIGGFRHGRPTHEAMVRWTEYAALLPIMQYGGGGENHNPWDFTDHGESRFTEETLAAFRTWAELHIRLFPYFWRLSERVRDEGLPLLLPPGLAFPGAVDQDDAAFLVGDDLYFAPVEEEGATTRLVAFPPGEWVHWWTGERVTGGQSLTVDAPLGAGPLYQRAGSVIPMLRPGVQTLSPTDASVDSWADDPGTLWARVVPGGTGGFGLSTGETATLNTETSIHLADGSMYQGWTLELWAPALSSVTLDGVELPVGAEGCVDCFIPGDPWTRVVLGRAGEVGWR